MPSWKGRSKHSKRPESACREDLVRKSGEMGLIKYPAMWDKTEVRASKDRLYPYHIEYALVASRSRCEMEVIKS